MHASSAGHGQICPFFEAHRQTCSSLNAFSSALRRFAGIGPCARRGRTSIPGQESVSMNQADTAWMLVATALVLLMTPALAFFYGGLVRSKNALNTMMMSVVALGFVGVFWAVLGYSLAFSTGGAWVGDLSHVFLRGVGLEPQGTIPHVLF